MIVEWIMETFKMIMFISMGFLFGVVVGVGLVLIGLENTLVLIISVFFAIGLAFFLAIIKKEKIEKIKEVR